jgi:hypothetical protein
MDTLNKKTAYKFVDSYGNVAWNILGYDSEWKQEWVLCCANSPDSAYFDGDADAYDPDANDCDHSSDMCWFYSDPELIENTDCVVCVMVGDDRKYVFHIDYLTPIDTNSFCPDCGATDCGWR